MEPIQPMGRNLKFLILFCVLCAASAFSQVQWMPVGPDGGDVRSLAYDPANPDRILLGTSTGQIYLSTDNGNSWARMARIGKGNDFVIDNIVYSPEQSGVIYVAAWTVESQGGGLFRSADGGKSWESLKSMEGKSIRALALAPSDPKLLVAGALDGIFRSRDGGDTWERISPQEQAEIKNIESLAVDPKDPNIIYAGTWHLPWKTTDGGRTWKRMKDGIIDDSDVFSIIVDPNTPSTIYLSACSGIYKSENYGALFHKTQGIPFSARRTRVLQQDPQDANVVYAGTTEGLWKTVDAGRSWKHLTPANVIVNDVMVDPRNPRRVLLATDRSGVEASNNAGLVFSDSNEGFAHRQVAALIADHRDSNILYAGVINDKEYGGVFKTTDAGHHWKQLSNGLGGRDVFALAQDENGTLLAGTNHGIFIHRDEEDRAAAENGNSKKQGPRAATAEWVPSDQTVTEKMVTVRKKTRKHKALTRKALVRGKLDARVADIKILAHTWVAATSAGIYRSANQGRTWEGGPVLGNQAFLALLLRPNLMVAAGRNAIVASVDGGHSWYAGTVPQMVTSIVGLCSAPDNAIWFASREGAYRSSDGGESWERIANLPVVDLASCTYDPEGNRMLVTGLHSTQIFESRDSGHSWRHYETGWLLRSLLDERGRLVASTVFDGVVLQPTSETEIRESSISSSGSGESQPAQQ